MLGKILSVIFFVYIMPCLVGLGMSRALKLDDKTLAKSFVVGNIFIWALFQMITVPLVLKKQSFLIVVAIVSVVLLSMCLLVLGYEVFNKKCAFFKMVCLKDKITNMKVSEVVSIVIMFGILGGFLYKIITLQHTDEDDARFIVNAVEIVRTNKMFLVDLITGNDIGTWIKETSKDITSPWAVYIAYFAKMTGVPVVIFAHSVLPVALIVCAMSIYWLFSDVLFKGEIVNRSLFVCMVILLNLYGFYSRDTAETNMLSRIWQGKGAVSSVAIPAMFLLLVWLYENDKKYGHYVLIALLEFAVCLMSGMGIVIGALFMAAFGFVFAVAKRKMTVLLLLWGFCVPNVIYYWLYLKYQFIPY